MTYMERYLYGEYEQVWSELSLMGSNVRQKEVFSDALAVAHETMKRIRRNIEVLIERLAQSSFVFGYDHRVQPLFGDLHPAEDRKMYLENFRWARQQPPVFLSAKQKQEEKAEQNDILDDQFFFDAFHDGEISEKESNSSILKEEEPQTMSVYMNEIENLIGPVPLSLRAWYEEVGGVNFYGHSTQWYQLIWSSQSLQQRGRMSRSFMSLWDPLMIYPLNNIFMSQLRQNYVRGKNYLFEFAPDRFFKDNLSGAGSPYSLLLPDPGMDFQLESAQGTFVHYLRVALLKWAGFPGMADGLKLPQKELNLLIHDLLPF